jgi:hypothetical protein
MSSENEALETIRGYGLRDISSPLPDRSMTLLFELAKYS